MTNRGGTPGVGLENAVYGNFNLKVSVPFLFELGTNLGTRTSEGQLSYTTS